jgi:hypothetical protein
MAAPAILTNAARASDRLVLVFAGGSTQIALEAAIVKPFTVHGLRCGHVSLRPPPAG